jgi:addiction module HigA family antidote
MIQDQEIITRDAEENGMRPVHPGEYIAEDLAEMRMSAGEYDSALAVPKGTVAELVAERATITPEIALRLSRYLGTTARLWMNLQNSYDLKIAEQACGEAIADQVEPRKANYSAT